MSYSLVIERFDKARHEFQGLLANMRADLEAYAAKPEASDKYLARQNAVLSAMYRYLTITTDTLQALIDAHEADKKAAFLRGMETQRMADAEYSQSKLRAQDKETARFNSVSRAMKQWPDLFL